MSIVQIESRFKEVTGLQHLDLSCPHFNIGDGQCQKTTKEEKKEFSWVTTPIWLVDSMIEPHMSHLTLNSNTCDSCCGCGQFSIRMMRKLYNKFPCEFNVHDWLKNHHTFTEFQFSNVAKLVYIFGTNITVYAGDTLNMQYSNDEECGILFFDYKKNKWFNIPKLLDILEPIKDDLDKLINAFTKLEKKLMPPPKEKKPKKVNEQNRKEPPQPKQEPTKIIKQITPKVEQPKIKLTPSKPKFNQKFVEVQVEMKIGGKYNPKIDFDDF